MFTFVHHVHSVVQDREAMVDYIAKHFAMTPEKLKVYTDRGMKDALYRVGPTLIEITGPLDPTSGIGQHLTKHGPSVYHVAWGGGASAAGGPGLGGQGEHLAECWGDHAESTRRSHDEHPPEQSLGLGFQLSEGSLGAWHSILQAGTQVYTPEASWSRWQSDVEVSNGL